MVSRRRRWVVLGVLWTLLFLAFLAALLLARASLLTLVLLAAAGAIVGAAVLFGLELRLRLDINRAIGAGRPGHVLEVVVPLLAETRRPRGRGPLLLYKAAALSLLGRWNDALAALDEVDLDRLPRAGNKAFHLAHAGMLFECLVFSTRLSRARSVFEMRLEPLAREIDNPAARFLVEESRAVLAFLDGELSESRVLFERLIEQESSPPASRAEHLFFLGCIAEEEGRREEADRLFDQAIALAPETFLPARIEKIRGWRRP